MAKSDSRLFITPSTDVEELVFDYLRKTNSSISVKGAKAITAYYLAETVFQIDPKMEDPGLRLAVLESMHELEARLNLIKSLFPDLVSTTTPLESMSSSSLNNGHGQSEARLRVVPDIDQREARLDNAGSGTTAPSAVEVDTSGTPWDEFSVISQKDA